MTSDRYITWQTAKDLVRECGTLPTDPHMYWDLEIWLMALRLRRAQKDVSEMMDKILSKRI